MKIIVVIGTRPEAIKMAPVVLALRKNSKNNIILCASGQHKEMLDIVLTDFGLRPDIYLSAPPPAPNLTILTAHLLQGISPMLEREMPDWLLVQGDTSTVMAAALAAFYLKIKVGHVEAGLRSFDKFFPFPEEMNRKMTTVLADLHFAPTETARQNLVTEGISSKIIHVTGNTVVDALYYIRDRIEGQLEILPVTVRAEEAKGQRLVLVTCHRRENFGEPLINICKAVAELADQYQDHSFIWPVHMNPNVQPVVYNMFLSSKNVVLLPPLSYESLLAVLMRSRLVLSDSGGIQEEAPSFGVPVLVLRDTTERPEGVAAGAAILVGADIRRIYEEATVILDDHPSQHRVSINPYGDGNAGERIAQLLTDNN